MIRHAGPGGPLRAGAAAAASPDEITGPRAIDLRLMLRLLGYARPHWRGVAGSLAIVLAASIPSLIQPYLFKLAVDDHLVPRVLDGLGLLALYYLGTLVLESALRFSEVYVLEATGQRIIHDLRLRIFRHLQDQSASFYDRNPVGRLVTRVTTDVEALNEMFSSGVVSILADLAKVSAIVIILWRLDARLMLASFAILVPLALASAFFSRALRRTYRRARALLSRLSTHLQESLVGIRLLQIFRAEEETRRAFQDLSREHLRNERSVVLLESLFSALVELLGTLAVALLLWAGGAGIAGGAVSLGTLVAFLQYVQRFYGPLRDLSGRYAVMQAAMAASERIFALLDAAPEITAPAVRRAPAATRGRIEFEDVWFSYPGGPPVLKGLSLAIEPGERVALAGATGAGKSTLVKLLARLYDPQRGWVRVDGIDLRDMDPREVRRRVGLILQDGALFAGTLEWNLTLGEERFTEERLWEALRLARIDGLVRSLRGGLREPVRERGGNFSAGERQLIALARALLFDPPVLVFDEATAAVDPATEAQVRASLRQNLNGRTALLIAHRFATLELAERVVLLEDGVVRESGGREDLARGGEAYRALYRLGEAAGGAPA
jgi:ATP-binding cassette subfamily B protein